MTLNYSIRLNSIEEVNIFLLKIDLKVEVSCEIIMNLSKM